MRFPVLIACALAISGLAGGVAADEVTNALEPGVAGRVLARTAPIAAADVFAYDVTSSRTREVRTDDIGRFLFDDLPAGMYKLVAFKAGFAPAVELLLRRRDDDRQFIELDLQPRQIDPATASKHDYWSVRGRIPSDVLRQIERLTLAEAAQQGLWIDDAGLFRAEMWAQSGAHHFGNSGASAALRSAEVDVQGRIGSVKLGLDGIFQEIAPRQQQQDSFNGEVRQLALHVEPSRHQRLQVATTASQMISPSLRPVDVEQYRVDWTGRAGAHGETRVSASYEEEQNFHTGDGLRPIDIPGYSETWGLEGSFHGRLAENTELSAGVSYRQRTLGLIDGLEMPDETLDLFTTAESQVRPGVVVEYGFVSSLGEDGSFTLMPHGGVLVRLGDRWQAHTSVAKRVEQRDPLLPYTTFDSAFFAEDTCHEAGDSCYEVTLARGSDDDEISVGAIHREFAETLRLYFSPDFFDRLESVFVVEGDELPEVQFSMVRRLSPEVLTRLESNVASGGGGIFYATDDAPYRNRVRYLVTSLDTRFQRTSTGVLLAFHHLEQALQPLDTESSTAQKVEMQRFQLMLTQDLDKLLDLATRWAVRLNMELSRGATPYAVTADGELYKKLTGGFAVSF